MNRRAFLAGFGLAVLGGATLAYLSTRESDEFIVQSLERSHNDQTMHRKIYTFRKGPKFTTFKDALPDIAADTMGDNLLHPIGSKVMLQSITFCGNKT